MASKKVIQDNRTINRILGKDKYGVPGVPSSKTSGKKADGKSGGKGSGLPLLKYEGDLSYDPVTGQQITEPGFDFTDLGFNYDQVNAEQISAGKVNVGTLAERFMTAADYSIVDPSQIAEEFGDITRSEIGKNADLSSEIALKNLDTELRGLQNFAPAAGALKRSEISKDNQFNQAERDAQLAQGDPNLRKDLEDQAARARSFASGRAPDSIQDRALELGIRSRAADAASSGGFGARSGAGRKAAELMSAEQRIALSQYGDQALTSNIGNRANLLLSPTSYSDAGQQIKTTPTVSGGQMAMQLASEANQLGIIPASQALTSLTQQGQFKSSLEQESRTTNVNLAAQRDLNQEQLSLQAQTTNVGNELQASTTNAANSMRAQEVNAGNAIQTQTTAKTLGSQERQFKSEMSFNVQNANADRSFQAANANAGRSLDVATANRQMKFDIQKTNKQMIYEDQQRQKAEAAANARAAAAASASRAASAASYANTQAATAANIQMQRDKFQFELAQQEAAMAAYREGMGRGDSSANWGVAGGIIARAPSLIGGVGSLVGGIRDGWSWIENGTSAATASAVETLVSTSELF